MCGVADRRVNRADCTQSAQNAGEEDGLTPSGLLLSNDATLCFDGLCQIAADFLHVEVRSIPAGAAFPIGQRNRVLIAVKW